MKIKLQLLLFIFFLTGFSSFSQTSINQQWNICIEKYDAKEYNNVITISNKIIENSKTPKDLKTEVFLLQGDAYFELATYKKAIRSYEIAFNSSQKEAQINIAKDIAYTYTKDKNSKKAIVWFNKEYSLAIVLKLQKEAIVSKITIAKLYSNYGDYIAAETATLIAQKLSNKNGNYKNGEIISLLQLIEENKKIDNELTSSFEKEKTTEKNKFIDKILIEKAMSIAEIEKLSEAMQLVEYKIKAQADEYEKKLLKEQLKTLEKEQELVLSKAKLDVTNATLREEQALNAKKKVQLMGGIIVLILLIVVIIILIVLYRFKQKTNNALVLKNEEIANQKNEIEKKAKHIEDSIQYSRKIQQALLPSVSSFESIFPNSSIYLNPKEKVSGDFFWHFKINNISYASAVDCTGHGVPGAFMTIICKQILDEIIIELGNPLPSEILELASTKITNLFAKHNPDPLSIVKDGMDLSIFRYNSTTHELLHAGARNPLYLIRNEELIELKGNSRSVGHSSIAVDKREVFTNNTLQIVKGDRIFLFSDGFPDQKGGEKNKKYFYKPFRNLLLKASTKPLNEQKDLLSTAFNKWIGKNEQIDDVLILAIEFEF